MSRASVLLALCLLPGFLACDSSSGSDYTTDAETLIAVDPADFPAVANCAAPEDGSLPLGAYVAELIDVSGIVATDGADLSDFSVRSSAPVPCGTSIGFGEALPKRAYEVNVRVYADLDADAKTVDICTVEGTTVTVTRENGKCTKTLATPLTTMRCYGWAEQLEPVKPAKDAVLEPPAGEPALAIKYRTVYAHYCVETAETAK